MKLEYNNIFEYGNEKYAVLHTLVEDNIKYGIASKLDSEGHPIVFDLSVFQEDGNEIKKVILKETLDKVLPKFQVALNSMIAEERAKQEQ